MKYRIYIDEVGNPDLESSEDLNHRFLSLTGVILELGYVGSTIHPQMEAIKRQYFRSHPDEPVIFHRKEMVNAKPPFESLRDPGWCPYNGGRLILAVVSEDPPDHVLSGRQLS